MSVALSPGLRKKSIASLPVENKRVLVRVDFNVPFDKATGKISDDSRLRAAVPTIDHLIRKKAKVVLISHLGRPKGEVNPKYSLKPVVEPLSKLLKTPVSFADDCIGPKAFEAVARLKPGDVLLLENLRYHAGEEKNNPVFGKELASLADCFVQDAFGAVHRAHASTSLVTTHLPSASGFLLEKEIRFLDQIRSNPARPYTAILGGAKVSDKIGVVKAFLDRVNTLFIGGAMAYTFLKAKGIEIGASRCEDDFLDFAKEVLQTADSKKLALLLPKDHLIVQSIDKPETAKLTEGPAIPEGWIGVDVGPKTLEQLSPVLAASKTVFWNGPAGIFETDAFSKGTMGIADALAKVCSGGAAVVVGGGDSVAAVKKAGIADKITFISTGGGASMEFLEGKDLPGYSVLPEA